MNYIGQGKDLLSSASSHLQKTMEIQSYLGQSVKGELETPCLAKEGLEFMSSGDQPSQCFPLCSAAFGYHWKYKKEVLQQSMPGYLLASPLVAEGKLCKSEIIVNITVRLLKIRSNFNTA